MARYITPSKIGTLALICLYTESIVPTVSSIEVLSFIVKPLLNPPNASGNTVGATPSLTRKHSLLSLEDFQKNCIVHPSSIPGRTLWDLLLKKLWEINSFDALHAFFDNLPSLLARSREEQQRDLEQGVPPSPEGRILLSRLSPLGTFVRRMHLEFIRLQFHDAIGLWQSFIAFRAPTLDVWKKRNPSASKASFDVNLHGMDLEQPLARVVYGALSEDPTALEKSVSTDDVERLLEFQVEEMQRFGNRVPREIADQLRNIIESQITIPSLSHYVRFLDSWRAGDYSSSFDNLHRYFDYTMHSRDRFFYQYALLNLAILQADFGCYSEAISAMQEAISTAREKKDVGCLNFCLSWLYHFGKAHPTDASLAGKGNLLGVEREGLAFLKAKAKESSMWSLWSTSILSEAKLGLENGESIASAFENILRSSHLNVTKGMMNAVGAQMLLQASMWARLGITQRSWSQCETFLQCYAHEASFDDVLRGLCRCAYIMAQKGRYKEAMDIMEEIDPDMLRSPKAYQYWATFSGILKLKRQIHKNHISASEHILDQLLAQEVQDPDVAFEIHVLQLSLLIRQGSFALALSTLEDLAVPLENQQSDIYHRVRLLTLKARILDKCGRPHSGFSIAVRAASIAWRARILPALWQAIAAVANVLVHVEEFEAAFRVLAAIMPQVLECEDAALSAHCYSGLVDAQMGMGGHVRSDTIKRKEHLTRALGYIDCAFVEYAHLEDIEGECEMMAKKATVMRLVGDTVLANDYAAKYLDLKRQWRSEDV